MEIDKVILAAPGEMSLHDALHIGGRRATDMVINALAPQPGVHILDVGCGLGGTARALAGRGCRVSAIDLDRHLIDAAEKLTVHAGLSAAIDFRVADALSMPFPDAEFDAAITMHLSMTIADKLSLYREIARVLKPGAILAIYDVMQGDVEIPPLFPLPWCDTAEHHFLVTPDAVVTMLHDCGFKVDAREDQTGFATTALEKAIRSGRHSAAAPADFPDRIGHLAAAIANQSFVVEQILARKITS